MRGGGGGVGGGGYQEEDMRCGCKKEGMMCVFSTKA